MKDLSKSKEMHFEMIQRGEKVFFRHFLSLVCWIDLMFQIVLLLNVFQDLAMLTGQEDFAYSSTDCYKKNLHRIDEKGHFF